MSADPDTPFAVAIVGLGPKGTYALDALAERLRDAPVDRAVRIDLFEPHPVPGAGPNYDPSQPTYLRMNFTADQISMWAPGAGHGRRGFAAWWRGRTGEDPERYPARAEVGRYLADGLQRVLASLPPGVRARLIERRVDDLTLADDGRIRLECAGVTRHYDEVLITTGHERSWDGALDPSAHPSATTIARVFPVHELDPDRVPPGSRVAIRGFGLTFIDAALALSEGRGGRFTGPDEGLAYAPSGAEPSVLYPWSRTGRPMLAKPAPDAFPELDDISLAGVAELEGYSGADPNSALTEMLARCARRMLARLGAGPALPSGAFVAWLAAAESGRCPVPADPAADIALSIAVAARRGTPGMEWALGHAWRTTYPAIVTCFGADAIAPGERARFIALAREMERLAFGPPPANASRLLALRAAGLVDFTHLGASRPPRGVDVVVDAVLPPPGVRGIRRGLAARLVRDGVLARVPGGRGLAVGHDGSCRAPDGETIRGLSALGRPTEDAIVGNDTLNRGLHPAIGAWARGVASRAGEPRWAVTP